VNAEEPIPRRGEPVDKNAFADLEERILEVNKVIAKLDPSIRVAAFDFLKSYISGGTLSAPTDTKRPPAEQQPSSDVTELIQKHGDGRPSDNVNLLAAIWFTDFGTNPFSLDYIQEKATATGLTIPTRPDKTLKSAMEKGKALFASAGKRLFKPTVVGEAFFRTTYNVRKGTKTAPSDK
jgi:hypothetical protein